MPKIRIIETDNTGSATLNPITNVVYIPGLAINKTEPFLCSSKSELDAQVGLTTEYKILPDLSLKLAERCLDLGMQVLYQGFVANSGKTQVEGRYFANLIDDEGIQHFTIDGVEFIITLIDDGDAQVQGIQSVEEFEGSHIEASINLLNQGTCSVQNSHLSGGQQQTLQFDFVNAKVEYNYITVPSGGIDISDADWAVLKDKNLYDIRFLTTGGYASLSQKMVECARDRGDCVALIDHPKDLDDDEVSAIRNYFDEYISATADGGKYAAGFTPWFVANISGEELEVPASFGYLFAYARSIQTNPTWYAVAGTFRGNIPELKEVLRKYTSAEVEILQGRASTGEVALDGPGDNVGFAINPIAFVRGYGYLIWGNRTLLKNAEVDGVGLLKATSFLNVRNLCSDIKKTLYAAAKRYTFEQNSNLLWLDFKSLVTPLLDRMVSGNGIEAYNFERVETTAKARLCARLTIVPIEGVEDFDLELVLEDALEVVE